MADLDERRVREIAREEHARASLDLLTNADFATDRGTDFRLLRRVSKLGCAGDEVIDALIDWGRLDHEITHALINWAKVHPKIIRALIDIGDFFVRFRGAIAVAIVTGLAGLVVTFINSGFLVWVRTLIGGVP